jgi:H+-translocating NAD(P) transhydrogenase subunit alpha
MGVDYLIFMVSIVFVLSIFVGLEVILKVPPLLHTPLMSITNAISGVVLVAAIQLLGNKAASGNGLEFWLCIMAIVVSSINVFGGFFVTRRMVSMFKGGK